MNPACSSPSTARVDQVVCHCLQVGGPELIQAITSLELRTLKEVRCATGAGEGCTACHAEIRKYLEKHAPDEVCCPGVWKHAKAS